MKETNPESIMREAFANSAGFLLGRASRILSDRLSNALACLNLSLYDFACLRMISAEVATTQAALGDICRIDGATMVGIIDRLEEQKLVVRERNESDRRSYRLLLTSKGGKILSRAGRVVANQQRNFLSPLSTAEWEVLRDCLNRLIWTGPEAEGPLP